MRHMARRASIHAHRAVRADMGIRRYLIGRGRVNIVGPIGERIYLSLDHTVWIVAGEAHLRVRAVPNQKILRDSIDVLNMRIVTACALHTPVDQLYGARWIGGLALCSQRGCEAWRILDRSYQAERMRASYRRAKGVLVA